MIVSSSLASPPNVFNSAPDSPGAEPTPASVIPDAEASSASSTEASSSFSSPHSSPSYETAPTRLAAIDRNSAAAR